MKELILTCIIKKETVGGYSALCPELDVASRGDTIEEAGKNLREAVVGHLQAAKEEGILDETLELLGLTKEDISRGDHIAPVSFSSALTVPLPA